MPEAGVVCKPRRVVRGLQSGSSQGDRMKLNQD